MKTVGPNRDPVPTTSHRKVVASPDERSKILRVFLDGILEFLTSKRPLPRSEGQLSDWIFALHGLTEKGQQKVPQTDVGTANVELVDWLHHAFGAAVDPRRFKETILQSEKLRDNETVRLADAYRSGDRGRFNREFDRVVTSLSNVWGVPHEISEVLDFSVDNNAPLLRASRATLICLIVYDVHPINLIALASRGSQEAVLKLIKVDKLFLCDGRTQTVIRDAAFQNDQEFIKRMARAQNYEPKLSARSARHAYFLVLFFAEYFGLALPTLHELHRLLDPHGRQYDTLQAFERDFQRRRILFNQCLAPLAVEFPLQ